MFELEAALYGGVMGIQAAAGDAGKAKGADKAVRKEAGRLTKLQEELERLEARCSNSFHPPEFVLCFTAALLVQFFWLPCALTSVGSMVAVLSAPPRQDWLVLLVVVQQRVHTILTGCFDGLAGLEWRAGCIEPNKVV